MTTPQVWLNDDGAQPAGEPYIENYTFDSQLCAHCVDRRVCDGRLKGGLPTGLGAEFQLAHWRIINGKPHCGEFKAE